MRTTRITEEHEPGRSRRFRGHATRATGLALAVKKAVTFRRLTLALTTSAIFAGLAVTPASAITGAAARQLPSICPTNFWAMDLKTGAKIGNLLLGSSVQQFPGSQAIVTLNFDPFLGMKCTRANIVVEYEGQPTGWTVDIGDSPSNDGYGGGSSLNPTSSCAEVQVRNTPNINGPTSRVDAYKDCTQPAPLDDGLTPDPNPLYLKDGALKFVVGNQYLTVGQPAAKVATPARSFHLPDTSTVGTPDGSKIYAAFNRVISLDRDPTRIGTGVRRIMITME